MSERRTPLDESIAALAGLDKGDTVALVTDSGSIIATVTAVRWDPDDAVVTLADRDGDQRIRVSTERYDGWLDPLVDAYETDSPFRFDLRDPDPDALRPIGSLIDVDVVSPADARPRQRGRP